MVLTVENGKASVIASGVDGVSGLGATFSENDIYFGVIRAIVRGQVKFFSVFVVGTDVGGMHTRQGFPL